MSQLTQISNVAGAVVANVINIFLIFIFVERLSQKAKIEYWLGIIVILCIVPLFYLLITGIRIHRPFLYFIQTGLMIAYLVVEFMLDYVLKIEFRQNQWIVLPYIMLFFAGTGGMIGVASHAGKGWTIVTIIIFLVMLILSVVQRHVTGQ